MTETLLQFFKAMADKSRLAIVGLLAGGERSVQELAAALDLKEPTVSHHLAILKAQGIVTRAARGDDALACARPRGAGKAGAARAAARGDEGRSPGRRRRIGRQGAAGLRRGRRHAEADSGKPEEARRGAALADARFRGRAALYGSGGQRSDSRRITGTAPRCAAN